MKVISFEVGILGVGLVRQQFEKSNEMLFDIVHDLGLLIADVECAGGPVSG